MSSFYIVNIVLLVIAIFNFIHALKELRSLQKGDSGSRKVGGGTQCNSYCPPCYGMCYSVCDRVVVC